MEESKELQGTYTLFRAVIYVTLLLEFFMYAINPEDLDFLGGIITGLHRQLQHLSVYQFLPYSKLVTLIMVIITCIGTKIRSRLSMMPRNGYLAYILRPSDGFAVCWYLLLGLALQNRHT